MLLVFDPNGMLCWEDVDIDGYGNTTLLPWLHRQTDALTTGQLHGTQLPLQVCLPEQLCQKQKLMPVYTCGAVCMPCSVPAQEADHLGLGQCQVVKIKQHVMLC